MAVGGENTVGYGALNSSDENGIQRREHAGRGQRRALQYAAGFVGLIGVVCVLTASGGDDVWRQKADLLLTRAAEAKTVLAVHAARGPTGSASVMKRQQLLDILLEISNSSDPSNSTANDSVANGTDTNSSETEAATPTVPCATFECWLSAHKDPEEVEDWLQTHKSSPEFSHKQWYEKHKGKPDSTADWYEAHQNYGNFSMDDWKTSHGLGIHPSSSDATAEWYKTHKNYGNFSLADWKAAHGVAAVMKAKKLVSLGLKPPRRMSPSIKADHERLESLAQLSSRLDGLATKDNRCGLSCWMAQLRHHDQFATVHSWLKKNKGHVRSALEMLQFEGWYKAHVTYGGPMANTDAWYATHKNYGGPEASTDVWYANHKNYTPDVAKWYEEHKAYGGPMGNTDTWYAAHKNYGGPEASTDVWYANHKNYTPDVAKWYEEHKAYGGPMGNTDTWYAAHKNYGGPEASTDVWYANHKNYTPDVAKWYEEHKAYGGPMGDREVWYAAHKNYGGPEASTDVWYANHKNYTPDVAEWYEEHKAYGGPMGDRETWYAAHKDYGGPMGNTDTWYAAHRNYGAWNGTASDKSESAILTERADLVRSVLLWEVVRSIEQHSLIKKLEKLDAANKEKTKHSKEGAPKSESKQQTHQQKLFTSTVERFKLANWLDGYDKDPHPMLMLGNGKHALTKDVSDYLDSKTTEDLDQWLSEEEAMGAGEKKSSTVLKQWMGRHASPGFGGWLQSFARESSGFRATANERLAAAALATDSKEMDQHAKLAARTHAIQSLKWDDESSREYIYGDERDFDFETWWAALGQNESDPHWQSHVGGSNWTKLLPSAEAAQITASSDIGSGACCCGFACEQASNDCCGAWYAAGGGESYMHYGSFKQNPRSVAALSARADTSAARMMSLAQVDSAMWKPLNDKAAMVAAAPKATRATGNTRQRVFEKPAASKKRVMMLATNKEGGVAQAFGIRGSLGWNCPDDTCTTAPLRVGATCEVECLSTDGINCAVAPLSCLDQAAQSGQDSGFVQCGAQMAKAVGTTGYDDAEHWCHCAKEKLAAQINSCRGIPDGEPRKGVVYADGIAFGPNIAFAAGQTFGNDETFGAGDSFESLEHFGNGNKFGKGTKFGMDNSFGNENQFEDGTVFGSGAKLGNDNKLGKDSELKDNAVLGFRNYIAEGDHVGKGAVLGEATVIAPQVKLGEDVHIGDSSVVGDRSIIAGGAVIGSNVKIGKLVTLAGVASIGAGTEIGEGSSFSAPSLALQAPDVPVQAETNSTDSNNTNTSEPEEYYRPDPGSPFARKGSADIDFLLDGHNHWPVFLPDENETDAAADFKTEPAAVESSTPTATAKVIGFVSLGDKVSLEKKKILVDERERVDSHKEERSSAADADSASKANATAVGSATPAVDAAAAAKAQGAVELAGKRVAKSTLPRSATVEEASAPHVTNLVVVAPQVAAVALKRSSSSSASAVAATAAARLAATPPRPGSLHAKQAAKAAENGPAAETAVRKALPAKRQADRDARPLPQFLPGAKWFKADGDQKPRSYKAVSDSYYAKSLPR